MIVRILKDGPKNLTILVKGIVKADFGPELILDLKKTQQPSEPLKGIRLDSAVWLIQEKMTLELWWGAHQADKVWTLREEDLALVMESRNFVRLDDGLPSPRVKEDKWDGKLYLTGRRNMDAAKSFMFILDLDKQ